MDGPGPSAIPSPSPVELTIKRLEHQWYSYVKQTQKMRAAERTDVFADIERKLTEKLSAITDKLKQKEEELASGDEAVLRSAHLDRDKKLDALQRSHQQQNVQHMEQVKALEEEERQRREAAAREQALRQQQQKQQEAAQRAAAEEEARRKAAEQQQQESEAAAKKDADKPPTPPDDKASAAQPTGPPAPADKARPRNPLSQLQCVAPAALKDAKERCKMLMDAEASVAALLADESTKRARKDAEKKLTVIVQQVSATQTQVNLKVLDVRKMLTAAPSPACRTWLELTLITKLLKQCESQVVMQNKAAFPLAAFITQVSIQFPEVMELCVCRLQRACPLIIPMTFIYNHKYIEQDKWHEIMGFRKVDSEEGPGKRWESSEEYSQRCGGYVLLYAAITQGDEPNNPHSLRHAWTWVARVINSLPPDRISAKALYMFIKVAGYKLAQQYRRQFLKLLVALQQNFLVKLQAQRDPNLSAVLTQLDTYLSSREFSRVPEGRALPKEDMSAHEKA